MQDGATEEEMQVQDLLGKADDLVDTASGRDLSEAENTKLQKMLDDAKRLLKEMSKTPAVTSRKKAKPESRKNKKAA